MNFKRSYLDKFDQKIRETCSNYVSRCVLCEYVKKTMGQKCNKKVNIYLCNKWRRILYERYILGRCSDFRQRRLSPSMIAVGGNGKGLEESQNGHKKGILRRMISNIWKTSQIEKLPKIKKECMQKSNFNWQYLANHSTENRHTRTENVSHRVLT